MRRFTSTVDQSSDFAKMCKNLSDNELSRFNPWTEMKFKNQTPVCRSFHACASYNGCFFIYGGVYGGLDAS